MVTFSELGRQCVFVCPLECMSVQAVYNSLASVSHHLLLLIHFDGMHLLSCTCTWAGHTCTRQQAIVTH